MKIKEVRFTGKKIMLPKEIEINVEENASNTEAMWAVIEALIREWRKDIKEILK